ncbi:MAG: Rpn family recombination-promoting nuclease/putative transposase [Gracilibacteraceae bacterium]|jgi:predicted transposase/invertase (TIGR01784 family)|nr:Rpn family recombination-promoting nuclease/putative transposase [Gracilibacteraceae bacterium]
MADKLNQITETPEQYPKLLKPKLDVVFKLLFGDKRNIHLLINFLKSVLDLPEEEYDSVVIEDPHLKRETLDDKLGIIDVRVTTKNAKTIHIEIQVLEFPNMADRATYYNTKLFSTQLKSGSHYDQLRKTISVVITDFNIIINSNNYHHVFQLRDKETGILFTDLIEIHTLELSRLPEHTDNTKKYEWLRFIRAEKEDEFMVIAKDDPFIREAYVELRRLSSDEQARRLAEDREKALRDEYARNKHAYNKGITEGRAEGRAEGKTEGISQMARKLRESGDIPVEEIARMSGLTVSEIENL